MVDDKWYPLYSVQPMIRFVKSTPVVDGVGSKIPLKTGWRFHPKTHRRLHQRKTGVHNRGRRPVGYVSIISQEWVRVRFWRF